MTYERACNLLGLTTPKNSSKNAEFAKSQLKAINVKTPLRYKVAATTIINAAS